MRKGKNNSLEFRIDTALSSSSPWLDISKIFLLGTQWSIRPKLVIFLIKIHLCLAVVQKEPGGPEVLCQGGEAVLPQPRQRLRFVTRSLLATGHKRRRVSFVKRVLVIVALLTLHTPCAACTFSATKNPNLFSNTLFNSNWNLFPVPPVSLKIE